MQENAGVITVRREGDGRRAVPATGGASGPLMMLLRNANLVSQGDPVEAVSEQGTKLGRRSLISLRSYADGRIEVGGRVTQVMTAELTIT